jgi:osmotically-inducible protein OsmY
LSRHKLFSVVAIGAVLIGLNCGCAISDGYRRCGLSGCPGDARISSDVRAQLSRYPSLESSNSIHVQTLDRVVFLTGQVDTNDERNLAESVVTEVAGVAGLVDTISLINPGG